MIDRYSRYAIVRDTTRLTAEVVTTIIDSVNADFGIMRLLKSDNGPPFKSFAFK